MPNRTAYRRATALRLGGHDTITVEASTNTTNATITSTAAFKSSLLPTDHLDQAWIYCPGAGTPRQRRVQANGLAPSTGVITLDGIFGSAPAVSSEFEIHTVMPAIANLTSALSVNGAVDLAMRYLLIPRTLTLDLVSGQYDYDDIQAYSWLDRPSRLVAVRVPDATGATTVELPKSRYELRQSGGANELHFYRPFQFAHGTFSIVLEARSPADTLINGADASAAPGLTVDADTAVPAINDVVEVALLFCYAQLAQSEDGARAQHYARMLPAQIEQARKAYGYDKEADIAASFVPLAGQAGQAA